MKKVLIVKEHIYKDVGEGWHALALNTVAEVLSEPDEDGIIEVEGISINTGNRLIQYLRDDQYIILE